MAISIDATAGGASSNSYLTVVAMNILAASIPHMHEWLTDAGIDKAQLLLHATRLLDRSFLPSGERAGEMQLLKWPRKHVVNPETGRLLSDEVVPPFVEMATAEWAWALRENPDPYDVVGFGLKRLETPSYRMEFNGQPQRLIPRAVSQLMSPYCMSTASPFHRVVRM